MTTTHEQIEQGLRAWAKGCYPTEAAVELLIRHGHAVYPGAPWLRELVVNPPMVSIDADTLLAESGPWSSGERRIVRIAASLLDADCPVELVDAVSGLDRRNVALVLAAIAHAAGSHEHSEVTRDDAGRPTGFQNMPSLYPWPA